ncbi:DNA-binding response OmpR family regulator [Acidovorax sp. 69]|uniref:response regulator transcription factor n=1 Tax=Acidovorax sp. 69 TaxID=2035202 RepID=UPI000C23DF14|nr:response regulator transcription factor [Acidovorax sp. 69]PJI99325.1 DNA-binding response OmpR family regulator [Acidovorax sp. 69]
MRIAVLDDDLLLLEQIKTTLECHNHVCHTYADGTSLLKALRQETFDLLIVDWHLPDMEGTDVVQTVRDMNGMQLPILFITRRNDERDVIEALSRGADDFMSKPLRMGELVARITALLRRAFPETMGTRLVFGPYRFDADKRTLCVGSQPIELKNREYELALFMFRNTGRLLSRTHLREAVWGDATETPSRSLDTHISRLRTKLELTPANGYMVSAIYGMGYRLDSMNTNAPLLPQRSTVAETTL